MPFTSDLWRIMHYMKRTVPVVVLLCSFMLEHHGFLKPCAEDAKKAVLACYTVLSILDFSWTFLMASYTFKRLYPDSPKRWVAYSCIQASVSVLYFIAVVYFTNDGFPLSCVTPYNRTVAQALFYVAFVLTASVAYVEHFLWRKLPDHEFIEGLEASGPVPSTDP
jgi:hypothetical protein